MVFALSALVLVVPIALVALGIAFGRRVVGVRPRSKVKILSVSEDRVTLPATTKTTHPGTFGLWTPTHHLLVGEIVDGNRRTVTRRVLSHHESERSGGRTFWEGDVFHSPTQTGPHEDISIPGPSGPLPAWKIGPASDRWAIHIHGIRATRVNALRTVPAARDAGFTSLVVTYRGDGEGPQVGGNAATLGLAEWRDVDAAISYARKNGATTIVLVGWSMGASLALLTVEQSSHQEVIAGTVLISPAVEWRQTMTHVARGMHLPLPAACSRLAELFLGNRILSRLLGLCRPIDFDSLDWTRPGRITVPSLIMHSPGDQTVPVEVSRQVHAANPSTVTLKIMAPDADHAWEYNVAPERFTSLISEWLSSLSATRLRG